MNLGFLRSPPKPVWQRTRPHNEHTTAYFLAYCDRSEAIAWLRKRPTTYNTGFGVPETPDDCHVPEYLLYRRQDPAIDSALAEHGRSRTVLRLLYVRGPAAIRITACANASLFHGKSVLGKIAYVSKSDRDPFLWRIVMMAPLPELRAICENPRHQPGFYEALLTAWRGDPDKELAPAEALDDERFKAVLYFLHTNLRLSQPEKYYSELYNGDGWYLFKNSSVFDKCWRLAEILPATWEWAGLLSQIFKILREPPFSIKDAEPILERWRLDDEGEFSSSISVRQYLAAHVLRPDDHMLTHPDRAVRSAFYMKFSPYDHEFSGIDWSDWLERDPYCHYDLVLNEVLWRTSKQREKLRQLCRTAGKMSGDEDVGFWFQGMEENYRKKHPDWFRDEDGPTELTDEIASSSPSEAMPRERKPSTAALIPSFVLGCVLGAGAAAAFF